MDQGGGETREGGGEEETTAIRHLTFRRDGLGVEDGELMGMAILLMSS